MATSLYDISAYFPYEQFRKHQQEILKQLQDYYSSYNYFMLEAPTGLGKSAVAYTLGKWVQGEYNLLTHICVADKFLQEQYLRDFKDLALVKGRGNFLCEYNPMGELTCDKAMCSIVEGFSCPHKPGREMYESLDGRRLPIFDEHGALYDWSPVDEAGLVHCPYWDQKHKAIRSDLTIHNYHYFLYEQNYAKSFSRRELGVFDEAHIVENILMSFVGKVITLGTLNRIWSERYIDERYKFSIPQHNSVDKWVEWLEETLVDILSLRDYYEDLVKGIDPKGSQVADTSSKYGRYTSMVDRLKEAINYLKEDPENWVWLREMNRVSFKPVTIKNFSSLLFRFTNKKLLMSATILDHEKLKRYLGIKEDVKFLRVDESIFPVENRLFYQDHQGKATRKTMDTYLPKMLDRIDEHYIPTKGHNKGVIHTHTHKIAEHIMFNSRHANIMVSNTGNEEKRHKVFQDFFDSEPPKVMVSPSMNLGVDLIDDRCRWQIITKIPYPNLGDPQIRKRLEMEPDWYDWVTLMTLIQTYGRGCRSPTDWCETYILDSMFAWLVSMNRKFLPKWFLEAIRRAPHG